MIKLTDSNDKPIDFSPEFKKNLKWGINPGIKDEFVFQIKDKYDHVVGGVKKGTLYPNRTHPNQFEVFDPWLNQTVKVLYLEPGATPEAPGIIMFAKQNEGKIVINGNDKKLFELLWVLRISPFNAANPLVSPQNAVSCFFAEIDIEKDAKAKIASRKERRQTEEFIEKAGEAKLAGWMQACNLPVGHDHSQNIVSLIEWLDKPENFRKFQGISSDVRTEISQLIRIAEGRAVIQYIRREAVWRIPSLNMEIVRVHPGQEEYDAIISFLHSEKKGQNMREIIEKELERPEKIEEESGNNSDPEKEALKKRVEELEALQTNKPGKPGRKPKETVEA